MTTETALLSPDSPRPPPPRSRMYTGASVITTQTGIVCLSIGYRNPNWHSLSKSVRLTNLSVYDNRDVSFDDLTLPVPPLLTNAFTQEVYRLSQRKLV